MNNINQYIFDILHFLAHLRDTLEYTLPRDHATKIFEQRKAVINKGLESETPLGKFFAANEDKTKDLAEKLKNYAEEVYGADSTVLVNNGGENIRVDHTQHIKIYDGVVNTMEQLRDIVFFHANLARSKNEADPEIEKLLVIDDRYYRVFAYLLILQDFQKSFAEFQKVMGESQGKPTPQSNFIVQNELAVYAGYIRNIRAHNHFIDNETLDAMDAAVQLIEMTEGRRERRDNKSFPDLFKETLDKLNNEFKKIQPEWQELFTKKLNEMVEQIRANSKPQA